MYYSDKLLTYPVISEIADPVSHRAKRDAPEIIYPECLIVIDNKLYK